MDAVGTEAHGTSLDAWYDVVAEKLLMTTERGHTLRQVLHACRKGGKVSIPGVYGGFIDKLPIGAAFGKGLQLRMGQTHVHRYLPKLMEHIRKGEIDPSFVITHRVPLSRAAEMYGIFQRKEEGCIKVVLRP
jgi:threonine dehydrogenase-like Zn-dependent dehydrogenase